MYPNAVFGYRKASNKTDVTTQLSLILRLVLRLALGLRRHLQDSDSSPRAGGRGEGAAPPSSRESESLDQAVDCSIEPCLVGEDDNEDAVECLYTC